MVTVEELQGLDPLAWTDLLARELNAWDITVTDVALEACEGQRHMVRYLIALAGHTDRPTFIGKRTNAIEARFYRYLAPFVPSLTARCWFSHVDGDHSWLIMDEAHNDRSVETWTANDVEAVIRTMASLHATFWDQESRLKRLGWLPDFIGPPQVKSKNGDAIGPGAVQDLNLKKQADPLSHSYYSGISQHAIRSAGRLAPALIQAASGLEKIREMGGWPGVLDEQQITAAADLIDDPLPMLQPLSELPVTLIHGSMASYHWQTTLFNELRLLEWQQAAIGAAVVDLVAFIEQFGLIRREDGRYRLRQQWPVSEETMIDSYMLHMSGILGARFNARAMRQAIPAARCLYILQTWLPRFAGWFQEVPNGRHNLLTIQKAGQSSLAESQLRQMMGLNSHLTGVFKRFLSAYRTL